jgi:dTDP-4-dehydrorhamnose 3,5-epimerase
MKLHGTPLDGLHVIETAPVSDQRGRFSRIFCELDFAPIRPSLHFTQINLSETSSAGTIRGLHYQTAPVAESKLIRCLRGRVFDVAVDLRRDSPTFLRWHAVELSEDNNCEVFIPEGFAHGFQSLTDEAHLLYLHTVAWTPTHEAGLRHDDPRLAIAWPLPATAISTRDRSYPKIDGAFAGTTP